MTKDTSTTCGARAAHDATLHEKASGGYALALRVAFGGAPAAILSPDAAPPAIAVAMARLALAPKQ